MLIMQQDHMGNPSYPGILEEIMDWPENRDFWRPVQGSNLCQEAPNTGEACCPHWWILSWGNHQKWKEAAVWSLTQRVAEVTEG